MFPMELRKERKDYLQRVKNGGLMFYVAAFATFFNVILYYVNFPVLVPLGSHTTQYWLVEECTNIGLSPIVGAILTTLVAAAIVGVGYLAREKRNLNVFIIATVIYIFDILNIFAPGAAFAAAAEKSNPDMLRTLDTSIVLLFDIYGAIMMFIGYRNVRKINYLDKQTLAEYGQTIPDSDDPVRDMNEAERKAYEAEKKEKGFLARKQEEKSVVSINPSAAWPEPEKDAKKAKRERIAAEEAEEGSQE